MRLLPPTCGRKTRYHVSFTCNTSTGIHRAQREPAHRSMDQVSISRISDAKYILYMVLSKIDVAYLAVETATASKVSEKQGMN